MSRYKYGADEKAKFIEEVTSRFKAVALGVIKVMEQTPSSPATNVMRYQLLKSATSASANYRAACRARSQREFFAKLSITVEETDETEHWLELFRDSVVQVDKEEIERLRLEISKLLALVAKARKNTK